MTYTKDFFHLALLFFALTRHKIYIFLFLHQTFSSFNFSGEETQRKGVVMLTKLRGMLELLNLLLYLQK